EAESPGQRVATGVVADRPDIRVIRTAKQREKTPDDRAGAPWETARSFVRDGSRLACLTQREELFGDDVQRCFPRNRLELRFSGTFLSGDTLQRSGESKAIVNELSHHRFALHAKAACLHRVFILAAHSDDAPVFEMHLETTERVAE